MTKRILSSLILVVLLLGCFTSAVSAQTYIFSVDQAVIDAYYNSDGTLQLDYTYVFSNSPSASPIDFVDIGLPNANFNTGNITATVDGKQITDISRADPQNLAAGNDGDLLLRFTAMPFSLVQPERLLRV